MLASKYAKRDMMESEFTQRANQITPHGLGLSVDVYSPDLMDLVKSFTTRDSNQDTWRSSKLRPPPCNACDDGFRRSSSPTTAKDCGSRSRIFFRAAQGGKALAEACAHIAALESAWLNHECATKQMAGYAFGTYLPPLYTALSASMTAENLAYVQRHLDAQAQRCGKRSRTGIAGNAAVDVFRLRRLSGFPHFFKR